MKGTRPRLTIGRPALRAGTCLHRDQYIDLLLKHQGIKRLLCALCTAAVIGDDQLDLPAKHSARPCDLRRGKFRD